MSWRGRVMASHTNQQNAFPVHVQGEFPLSPLPWIIVCSHLCSMAPTCPCPPLHISKSLSFLFAKHLSSLSYLSELQSGTQHGFRQMIIPAPFRNHPLSKRKQVVKIIICVFCLSLAAFPATLHRADNCGFSQSVT